MSINDINTITNEIGYNMLRLANFLGHTEIVKLLIGLRADINAKNDQQFTPLHIAALNGYTEIVKLLLGAGANVDTKDNQQVTTPLYVSTLSPDQDKCSSRHSPQNIGAPEFFQDVKSFLPENVRDDKQEVQQLCQVDLVLENSIDFNKIL